MDMMEDIQEEASESSLPPMQLLNHPERRVLRIGDRQRKRDALRVSRVGEQGSLALIGSNDEEPANFENNYTQDSSNPNNKSFRAFAKIIQNCINKKHDRNDGYISQNLQICSTWIENNSKRINNLRRKQSMQIPLKEREMIMESQIWKLIQKLRLVGNVRGENKISRREEYLSPWHMVNDAMCNKSHLYATDRIIEWLQDMGDEPSYMTHGSVRFTRTQHASLERNERHFGLRSLDLDVLTREKIEFSELSEDERKDFAELETLFAIVFDLLRKGMWSEAMRLCQEYKQFWLCASMNGRTLFNNKTHVGNQSYLLWLQSCFKLSQNSQSSAEKMIYALLSGNLEVLVDGLQSGNANVLQWQNLLWAALSCKRVYSIYNILMRNQVNPNNSNYTHRSFYCRDLKRQFRANNDKKMENIVKFQQSVNQNDRNVNEREQRTFKVQNERCGLSSKFENFMKGAYENAEIWDILDVDNRSHFRSIFEFIEKSLDIQVNDSSKQPNGINIENDPNMYGLHVQPKKAGQLANQNNSKFSQFKTNIDLEYYKIVKYLVIYDVCDLSSMHNDFESILTDCWTFMNESNNKNYISLNYIRFIIHLYLFLNPAVANNSNRDDAGAQSTFLKIVKYFIKLLIQNEYYDLVAIYCLILNRNDLISTYCDFLENLDSSRKRAYYISQTEKEGIFPSEYVSEIAQNIAMNVIGDESACQGNNSQERDWHTLLELTDCDNNVSESDIEKLDALKVLLYNNDNKFEDSDSLRRCNQLFVQFSKYYKDATCMRLHDDLQQMGMFDKFESLLALRPNLVPFFNTLRCYQSYCLLTRWFATWAEHASKRNQFARFPKNNNSAARGMDSININGAQWERLNEKNEESVIEMFRNLMVGMALNSSDGYNWSEAGSSSGRSGRSAARSARSRSTFAIGGGARGQGWMNPKCCAIYQMNTQQLIELKSVMLTRLVKKMIYFAIESKRYEFAIEIMKYVVDESYGYYKCLDKNVLQYLLISVKDAKVEMIRLEQNRVERGSGRNDNLIREDYENGMGNRWNDDNVSIATLSTVRSNVSGRHKPRRF